MAGIMGKAYAEVRIGFEEWRKAHRAKRPTPEQTCLLDLWSKIDELVYGLEVEHYEYLDSEDNLFDIHVSPEGKVWLGISQQRTFSVPLDDVSIDSKERALIEETIQRLISKRRAKLLCKTAESA